MVGTRLLSIDHPVDQVGEQPMQLDITCVGSPRAIDAQPSNIDPRLVRPVLRVGRKGQDAGDGPYDTVTYSSPLGWYHYRSHILWRFLVLYRVLLRKHRVLLYYEHMFVARWC
jgi:hypothetical protein